MNHYAKASQRASSVKTAHKVIWKGKLFFGNSKRKGAWLEYKGPSVPHLYFVHELLNFYRSLKIKIRIRGCFKHLHGISQVQVKITRPKLRFKIRGRRNLYLSF